MSKRELVLNAFDNKEVERVPVGFWFHFAPEDLFNESPEIIEKNIIGHHKFFEEFKPDFLKLMSDGYFTYPIKDIEKIEKAEDLKNIDSFEADKWIDKQVKLVKQLTDDFKDEVVSFYNIFAPATYFKFLLEKENSKISFNELLKINPELVSQILDKIGDTIAELAKKVIIEGGADGIYLSVQNIQNSGFSKEEYLKYIAPSELKVLNMANSVSQYNILHICGYEGSRNDITIYEDYPAKAINWAVTVEGVNLKEGKKIFKDKAVIGGFANTTDGILYKGSKAEIEDYTEKLLRETGTKGIILGADCTIPSDTPYEHLEWVRNKAKEFLSK